MDHGKSTLLKLMTKIIYPDKGTIKTYGKLTSLLELGAGFHPDFSGRENIYFNASIFGLTKAEIDQRVEKVIEFSELGEFIDNPVRTYSSGMYMRLAFSVAINVDADILLIDEILSVGDEHFQTKCFDKLHELKAQGKTIVFVTHSLRICRNIFKYRELLKNNVKKEVRGRYKNSILGVMWTFLNPLLQIAVYAMIFPYILKQQQPYYLIFVCVGLIPWSFFTTTIIQSTNTIIGNANIVKKVYFPREILPLSVVLSGAINFLIATIIILAFCIGGGKGITWHIIIFPIILLLQMILQLAISFVLSAVTVYIRDIEHFVQIVLMLMFYATPIVYSTATLDGSTTTARFMKKVIMLNPMTTIIEGYRSIFYTQTLPDFKGIGIWYIISIALLFIGWLIFKKLQKGFAEEL